MTDEQPTERALLQRRIRNQRAEIRRLNRTILSQAKRLKIEIEEGMLRRAMTYRHAAEIAERFWFSGRISKAIRRWV